MQRSTGRKQNPREAEESSSANRQRIVVVMPTDMSCYREAILGINAYATTEALWHIDWFSPVDDYTGAIVKLKPDGLILGPVSTSEESEVVRKLVPRVVGCLGNHSQESGLGMLEVNSDDMAVGRMAAQFFLDRGYRNFAYISTLALWSDRRLDGFASTIRAVTGTSVPVMQTRSQVHRIGRGWARPEVGDDVQRWLLSLPKPLGLFVCNDMRARAACEVCLDAGLRVPQELSILGVDNDDLECEVSHPPLSSVQIPWRQAGYRAAELMGLMIRDERLPKGSQNLPPIGVIERQSTGSFAVTDLDVSMALDFIRKNAHAQIGVADILEAVPAARRTFEKRFRAAMGRSPLDEIRRAHVERAKQLLLSSDLSMGEIAERSGFASAAWFTKTFCDLVGETPSAYRSRIRRS